MSIRPVRDFEASAAVPEVFALLRYYVVCAVCCLPTIRNKISVPYSRLDQSKMNAWQQINPLFYMGVVVSYCYWEMESGQ